MIAQGEVIEIEGVPGWMILDPLQDEFEPATEWFRQLVASDKSPGTVRAYAHALLRYVRFLWASGRPWQEATEIDTQEFVLWMKEADKFVGAKRQARPRPGRNQVTGKPNAGKGYSRSTINASLTAGRMFFEYHQRNGGPIIINPFPRIAASPHAHHNPMDSFLIRDRDPYRQKTTRRVPRAIPDEKFEELFRSLRCNRDRALLVIYVTSGARATEVLRMMVGDVDWGDSLITLSRKGGHFQQIAVGGHGLVWLRLYLMERGNPSQDKPLWVTERQPFKPLSYDACRAVLRRAQAALGSNWTLHDLRHTFTIRALADGMQPKHVSEQLGHASMQTLDVYSTPSIEDIVNAHRGWIAPPATTEQVPAALVQYAQEDLDILWG